MPSTGILNPNPPQLPSLPEDLTSSVGPPPDFTQSRAFTEQPRGAGWMNKGGKIADVASSLLQGWLAGKHTKEVRKLEQAKTNVNALDYTRKAMFDQWERIARDPNASEDQKKAAEAAYKKNVDEWYQGIQPYVMPEEGKDKGKGGKKKPGLMSRAFGAPDPTFIAGASANLLYQTYKNQRPDTSSVQDEAARFQLDRMKKDAAEEDRWKSLAVKDYNSLNADDRKFVDYYERVKFGRGKEAQVRDELFGKLLSNGKLEGPDRELGIQMGIIRPSQTQMVGPDKNGFSYLLTLDADGNPQGQPRKLPIQFKVPPDQATIANEIFNGRVQGLKRIAREAHGPKSSDPWSDEQVADFALQNVALVFGRGAGRLNSPAVAKAQEAALDKAMRTIYEQDPDRNDYRQFFVATGGWNAGDDKPEGKLVYRTDLAPPETITHWFKPDEVTYGGKSMSELITKETSFRQKVKKTLREQNPQMTEAEIDQMMPPALYSGRPSMSLEPTPSATNPQTQEPSANPDDPANLFQ